MTLILFISLIGAVLINSPALSSTLKDADIPSVKSLYFMSAGGDCTQPSERELKVAEELFSRTLKGEQGASLTSAWSDLGFNLIPAKHNGSTFLVLMEKENEKSGRGFYLFRDSTEKVRYLIMPHRFTDEDTGNIGLSLALEGSFPAAAWNTVRRYPKGQPENKKCDMARLPASYFTAFTRALGSIFPKAYHIQIHGFEHNKRKSEAGESANLIISGGDQNPRQELFELKTCLGNGQFGAVRLYPNDIRELGATGNISGQILRNLGSKSFVHIEISHELRKELKEGTNLRKIFIGCLDRALP